MQKQRLPQLVAAKTRFVALVHAKISDQPPNDCEVTNNTNCFPVVGVY
jgi:hypothetical protein